MSGEQKQKIIEALTQAEGECEKLGKMEMYELVQLEIRVLYGMWKIAKILGITRSDLGEI